MICAVSIEFNGDAYTNRLHGLLPSHAIHKSEKYHFADDRKRSLTGELLKRSLLAELLKTKASELTFGTNRFNKPELNGRWENQAHFNLSHSGNWVVIAIDDEAVGIDIELIKPQLPDVEKVVFTEKEINEIYATSPQRLTERFFKQWTRKESYIKAIGLGFSADLKKISILDSPDGSIQIETDVGDSNWVIQDLQFDPKYGFSVCSRKKISSECTIMDLNTLIESYH